MRKLIVILGLIAAFAVPAASAEAKSIEPVICGGVCDGGGGTGYTGCTQQTESHGGGIPLVGTVRHFVVVAYCKQNGIITSASIVAHGCDVGGIMFCHVGAAWQTGGGVGASYATFQAHATWGSTNVPGYNNFDILNLTVAPG